MRSIFSFGGRSALLGHIAAQVVSPVSQWRSDSGPLELIGAGSGGTFGTTYTGTWTTTTFSMTAISPGAAGLVAGMFVNSDASTSGLTPPTEDTISSVTNSTTIVYLSTHATTAQTAKRLNFSDIKGSITSGGNIISSVTFRNGSTYSISSLYIGMGIYGNGIPAGTTITDIGAASITMSQNATRTGQCALIFLCAGAQTTTGSANVTNVVANSIPFVGKQIDIAGANIPAGTTITSAPDSSASYQAGTGTLVMSANAGATVSTRQRLLTQ